MGGGERLERTSLGRWIITEGACPPAGLLSRRASVALRVRERAERNDMIEDCAEESCTVTRNAGTGCCTHASECVRTREMRRWKASLSLIVDGEGTSLHCELLTSARVYHGAYTMGWVHASCTRSVESSDASVIGWECAPLSIISPTFCKACDGASQDEAAYVRMVRARDEAIIASRR